MRITLFSIIVTLLLAVTINTAEAKEEKSTELLIGIDLLSMYQAVNGFYTDLNNVPKLLENKETKYDKLIKELEEMELETKEAEKIREKLISTLKTGKITDALTYLETYAKRFLDRKDLEESFISTFETLAGISIDDSSKTSSFAKIQKNVEDSSWFNRVGEFVKGLFSKLGFE